LESRFSLLCLLATCWPAAPREDRTSAPRPPAGWTTAAPRDEIRPAFAYEPVGGPDGQGVFVIPAAQREGLDGCWTKTFPIAGGRHYHFQAFYQAHQVAVPRRSILVKLHWRDAPGPRVVLDEPVVTDYLRGATAMAETEFPRTKGSNPSAGGWTELSDT
jgi:hypothetical protein